MNWQKKYRWTRTWGDEPGLNGKPHEDYVAHDGEVAIGRIYLDQQTLKAGRWRWAIQYPKGGQPYLPNSGWEETVAEAAKVIEECWDRQIKLLTENPPLPGQTVRSDLGLFWPNQAKRSAIGPAGMIGYCRSTGSVEP